MSKAKLMFDTVVVAVKSTIVSAIHAFPRKPKSITVLQEPLAVETIRTSVLVEALPTDIPSSIELDISDMEIGDALRMSDLTTGYQLHLACYNDTVPMNERDIVIDDWTTGPNNYIRIFMLSIG